MHFKRGKNSAGLGWVGELRFCFRLGLMWQKVARSWLRNSPRLKAFTTPVQCIYVLDLCKVNYTTYFQTKQLPASGNPARALWLPHSGSASPVSSGCRAPRKFPAAPPPVEPQFKSSSCDSLALGLGTSGYSALNLFPYMCRGVLILPMQAGTGDNIRRCL